MQHVIFRLADALPAKVRAAIALLKPDLRVAAIDRLLDAGDGASLLKHADVAEIVANALRYFDGKRYKLHAWCIMPNHVHVLVEPLSQHELGSIIKSWKAFSAARINKLSGRVGRLWAPDYFDRFVRDEPQFVGAVSYIENNPVAAKLCSRPEDWRFSSAHKRA